jgi:prepilin-type N-terminal cleavage/methylation domain-containing protein
MHRPRSHLPSPASRRAFTVAEVLVALVIVSVGLLGMAGTSALSLRAATSAARERRAVGRLALRHATLLAGGCAHAVGGARDDPGDGVRERWTVGPPARGVVMIDATAQWRDGDRPRTLQLRSALLC